jgi:hypothetical protein
VCTVLCQFIVFWMWFTLHRTLFKWGFIHTYTMNAMYSNPTFQYTENWSRKNHAIIGMPKWQQIICNAAYCGKFMFTCQPHTIRIMKPTFLSFQNEYYRQMKWQQKRVPDIYYLTINDEIKTHLALGSVLNACTVTMSENNCDRLGNYVSGNLCMTATHTMIQHNNHRLFFFITCILTYIQHHAYSYDIHGVPPLQTMQWHKIYRWNSDIPKLSQTQKIQVPM